MKNTTTPLVDDHLRSVEDLKEVATDEFFYTRLKARMQRDSTRAWSFPLRPAWVIGTLMVLLAANGYMLSQRKSTTGNSFSASQSLQNFAASYDQTITSSY